LPPAQPRSTAAKSRCSISSVHGIESRALCQTRSGGATVDQSAGIRPFAERNRRKARTAPAQLPIVVGWTFKLNRKSETASGSMRAEPFRFARNKRNRLASQQ